MIIDKLKCSVTMPLKREMGLREIEKRWILNSNAKRGDIRYEILTIFSVFGLSDHTQRMFTAQRYYLFLQPNMREKRKEAP